ncbi:hypothetical protein DM02DRAFT_663381 [Periconia macrospinosa]|uniref:Uncharacterized protein n=1 Tax=Periconia macrospinosa TaxID=97972 RepID=A0A2V1D1T9_9PLEO|nr:hypothetical protein DM02DRAFT_663381 [Periconia macrospinosa]
MRLPWNFTAHGRRSGQRLLQIQSSDPTTTRATIERRSSPVNLRSSERTTSHECISALCRTLAWPFRSAALKAVRADAELPKNGGDLFYERVDCPFTSVFRQAVHNDENELKDCEGAT